jgi:hypothetical protein
VKGETALIPVLEAAAGESDGIAKVKLSLECRHSGRPGAIFDGSPQGPFPNFSNGVRGNSKHASGFLFSHASVCQPGGPHPAAKVRLLQTGRRDVMVNEQIRNRHTMGAAGQETVEHFSVVMTTQVGSVRAHAV